MNASLRNVVSFLALCTLGGAQSLHQELRDAISGYTSLSTFSSLLEVSPESFDQVLEGRTNVTVLVPTNDAITDYLKTSGQTDVTKIKDEDLKTFFLYHTMVASLKSAAFDGTGGLTVPTLLEDKAYNNRTAGEGLEAQFGANATGQVLFAGKVEEKSSKAKRQSGAGGTVQIRAGLAQDVEMTTVDGSWGPNNSSTFQIIDKVLIPPRNCSTTVRSVGDDRLKGLDVALKAAKLWPTIDRSYNVTCLAPSTQAFKEAGNPEETLSQSELSETLFAHTLDQVAYTNYLEDGMTIGTLNGTTVRVSFQGDDIYFNNAKVIKANVLTNNGLIHILDSVIQPGASATPTGTSSASASATSSTSSASPTNAGSLPSISYSGVVAVALSLLLSAQAYRW